MTERNYELTVSKLVKETDETVSIYFNIPEELKEIFNYLPGQYITLIVDIDGEPNRRAYSLSSSPDYDYGFISITAKKVDDGKVSKYLCECLREGDKIGVLPPRGNFHPDINRYSAKNYFLIGAGSGITPLMSILKSLLKVETGSKINLIYGNKNQSSAILYDNLEEFKNEFPDRFRIIHTFSKPSEDWKGLKGRISKDLILEILDNYSSEGNADDEFYICGPYEMTNEVRDTLIESGIPSGKIFRELYTLPKTADTDTIVEEKPDEPTEGQPVNSEVKTELNKTQYTLTVHRGQTILEAAMQAGIDPPYSCRSGICTTCRAKLISGKVRMDEREGLSDSEIEEGFILTCQSHPLTEKAEIKFG